VHSPGKTETLERIYELPVSLKAEMALRSEVSLLGLVMSTGYPVIRSDVDVALLQDGIRWRREILGRWLRYSAEKDATWGWFFEVDRRGSYSVGRRSGFSEKARFEIADPWEACAFFIKQELDAIVGTS
jgi:hypothetical protein